MLNDFLDDKNRRRGIVTSLLIHFVLLLLFLFVGLTYYDPKPEAGILINFGDSESGFGENPTETAASKPTQSQAVESPETETPPTQTQSTVEAPSLPENKKQSSEKPTETKPTETTEKATTEPETEPEPSKSLTDLLNKTRSSQEGGEGVTEGPGDQGSPDGDPRSTNRSGDGGGGEGDGNYLLGGRQALSKPKPEYPCNDEGRVVVKIYVNRNGEVQRAIAGERIPGGSASTTTSSCLYDQARRAALRTTWEGDPKAPEVQAGYIIYNFKKQ